MKNISAGSQTGEFVPLDKQESVRSIKRVLERRTIKKYSLFLILLIIQLSAAGQSGTIKGRVFNETNNEPIPFANIIIYETTIGSTTDLDGNFTFTGVEPGFIRLAVSAVGFEQQVTEDFQVTTAKTTFIDVPMKETQVQLDEVVVKASPFTRKDESPVSVQTLQISEIEKNPGGNRDISRVIQSLPGVSSSPSFRNDVIVRGGGSSENTYYIDDVEIPNLNHFSTQGASGGPVGIINADLLREAELYTGAFPANRGEALSSVLEMKFIDGNPDKMSYKATVGATDLGLTINGPITKKSTLVASVRRSYLQFLFDAIGLPFLPTYNDLQFKYKIRFDQKNELSFIGIGAVDQFRLNTGLEDPDDGQQFLLGVLPVNEQYSYTVGMVYKRFKKNGFDTYVISRNYLDNRAFKYPDNNESQAKIFDYKSTEAENKFRFEHKGRIGAWRYIYGAGAEYAQYTNNTYQLAFIQGNSDTVNYNSSLNLWNYGAFGQASKGFFNDRLTLSLGVRLDGSAYDEEMANPLNHISPRFSASYGLSEKFFLNFNVGRYFQKPPYTTLGYRDNNGTLVNKENNISYIQSDHLVAGVEFLPSQDARITLEGFYKWYDRYPFSVVDSINIASKGADFGTFGDEEVLSISKGRAYGFEVLVREQMFKGFNVILAYTYVRSEFTDKDDNYVPSSWDNRHIINLTVLRSFKKNWDVGAKWRFVAGYPYTPADLALSSRRPAWDVRNSVYLDYNRFNQERLLPFHQLDIRVDKSWFFEKWALTLYVDIQNLYNFKADEAPIYTNTNKDGEPMIVNPSAPYPDQLYDLRRIESESGTILPTIGVIVEI